jgi:outer membrane protein assembly factor BamB
MALLNNTLYVNEQLDLYSLDASSGNIQWKRTFDHNLLTPIRVDDKIFVVADGYVIAYE